MKKLFHKQREVTYLPSNGSKPFLLYWETNKDYKDLSAVDIQPNTQLKEQEYQ